MTNSMAFVMYYKTILRIHGNVLTSFEQVLSRPHTHTFTKG
jgi:hypothetical protein